MFSLYDGFSIGLRDLLVFVSANLQTRLGIKPVHALVIDLHALLPQLQVDDASTVTPVTLCQRDDLLLEDDIAVGLRLVTPCAWTQARHTQ